MRPKFEPDAETGADTRPSEILVDPEAYDASEQQFAASLEQTAKQAAPKFVLEAEDRAERRPRGCTFEQPFAAAGPCDAAGTAKPSAPATQPAVAEAAAWPRPADLSGQQEPGWRHEVAARLHSYRTRRRPKAPRYPSLRLQFEPGDARWSSPVQTAESTPAISATRQALAVEDAAPAIPAGVRSEKPREHSLAATALAIETTAKVIAFPRSSAPPKPLDELAEPLPDRPRIIEAPELVPPPPALGGILIEPVEEPANERRPGFEIPLQPAPLGRRLVAAAIDGVFVTAAFALFSYLFVRIAAAVPPLPQAAGAALLVISVFWVAYQYLLLVHCGITPGLRLTKLELHRFDGTRVPRRIRRWRVLASVLAGISLGLGYAWCFLDEDQLCWHDRITHTYMAPK